MAEMPGGVKEGNAVLRGRRILLLFPHMVTPGGALAYTLRLAGQLAAQGATVGILNLREERSAFRLPAGVETLSLGGPLTSSLAYWLLFPYWQAKLARAIAAWQPDLLVPQVFPANWWGWLYKGRHPQMKLVWVCHEPSAFIHSPAWIAALRPWWKSLLARLLRPALARVDVKLARRCDRTIANSCFTAAEMQGVYDFTADAVARPGIEMDESMPQRGRKEKSLITVARLTRFKRIDFLLEVFAEVLKTHPDLRYVVVGSGEEEERLRAYAVRLGVAERVDFRGAVDGAALADLYRTASLYLHGSIGEPFGMAPLEAIAGGTPVVAHASGGPQEYVTAACGRLLSSLDRRAWAAEIAAWLDRLASDPELPVRVRACARPFVWQYSLRPALKVIADLCTGPVPGEDTAETRDAARGKR